MDFNPISINSSEPFKFDTLDRASEIKNLNSLIFNIDSPLVLSIDSAWGTGKTTFIRMWHAFLKQQQISSVYFNAWTTDYAEDPLIAIISELDEWIIENSGGNSSIKLLWSKAKSIFPKLAERTVVSGVKLATMGIIDLPKDYENVVVETAGGFSSDILTSFKNQSQAIKDFKVRISQIIEEFRKKHKNQSNFFIFIDELDRCRPTYAIELLERIKHLFDIPGLVFVLSTDLAQLSNSICAVYGSRFDSRRYLQRFIDLEYSLKEPQRSDYINALTQSLGISHAISNKYKSNYLFKTCVLMSDICNSDLRSINSFLWRLKLSLSTYSDENRSERAVLIAMFLSLRLYDVETYRKCQVDPVARVELLEKIIGFLDFNNRDNILLLSEIFYCFMGTTFLEDSADRKQSFYSSGSLIESILSKIPFSERDYINERVSVFISGGSSAFEIQEVIEKVELFSRVGINN